MKYLLKKHKNKRLNILLEFFFALKYVFICLYMTTVLNNNKKLKGLFLVKISWCTDNQKTLK